jgi:hypothetical protein
MNICDLEFIFISSDDDIFTLCGENIEYEAADAHLRKQLGVAYKKTGMADIARALLSKTKLIPGSNAERFVKWISFLILLCISPKTTRIFRHDFSEITVYLKNDKGIQYFEKHDIENNEALKSVVDMLIMEDFIAEREDRLYIKGYYLDGLKFINLEN